MESKTTKDPDGPAYAAILAAGIGCFSFGVLVDLTEASDAFKSHMSFYNPSGDLSGKSTIAVAIWLIAWAIFHFRWRGKHLARAGAISVISTVLIALSLVMTFPPVFGDLHF